MSLLDWVQTRQQKHLSGRDVLRSVEDRVKNMEDKVVANADEQIQMSSLSSTIQRDNLIMQRIAGHTVEPTRDFAETLAVPPVWRNRGEKRL